MGNRDIWKISRRPSSTSSYQGNMYILIATAKRTKPCKKGRESLIWFCSPFQFQERVLFAPFWSSKCSNRPCSGFLALQGSLKCHGIAVKTTTMAVVQLPKSLENRSTTTPLVGTPGRPCLRWTSRNVFFVTGKEKKLKAAEATRHLPAVPWSLPQQILLSAARILMRKDDVCSWKSTSWQTFMRRKWCIMPLPTESTPAPSPWTPLPLPTRRIPKVLLIIQRLSPMTATRHVPSNVLPQWSRSGSPMLFVLWVY